MIFKKKHNNELYNILLNLSRNLYFYKKLNLKDTFETRIYLIFIHFSIFLIIFKLKKTKFSQDSYDSLFINIENNLREMGLGDVAVNKKMKDLNKILYDILLKINSSQKDLKINKELIIKYFNELNAKDTEYQLFEAYLVKFYNFCFDKQPDIMIKEALNFRI